jgi:hypothetical protein
MAESRRTTRSGRTRLIGTLFVALVILLLAVVQVSAAVNGNPPTPRFVSPLDGWTVEGTVPVMVKAPDLPLFNAELGVDGGSWQPMHYKGNGVFFATWNSAYVQNGKHILTARFALELGGPPDVAVSIHVLVQNEEIPPQPIADAGILSHPCIQVMPAYGLKPNECHPPVTN